MREGQYTLELHLTSKLKTRGGLIFHG